MNLILRMGDDQIFLLSDLMQVQITHESQFLFCYLLLPKN
jgi:hypothetical protein